MPKVGQPAMKKSGTTPSTPPSGTPSLPWTTRRIEIVLGVSGNARTSRGLPASVLACFAVHEDPFARGSWAVTSVPTGLRIALVSTEVDARRIAETLWRDRHCFLAFRPSDPEEVRSKVPSDVVEWLRQCYHARRYVPLSTDPVGRLPGDGDV